jgi:hypothetical protein
MKRGTSKYPPPGLRLKSEDIIKVDSTVEGVSKGMAGVVLGDKDIDNTFEFQEEFQENVEIRNKQYQESKNFQDKGEDDDDDEEEEEEEDGAVKEPTARQSMKAGGAMIFARNQADKTTVRLEDFIIMKMVGKGTFGKVFLVQHMHNKKIYAMKCIRKDIVIDNE